MLRLVMTLLMLILPPLAFAAPVTVTDGSGKQVTLQAPAQRIISLAPHTTELLFAAGAGEHIVGVVDYSDYPPEARKITHVGGYDKFDLEAVVALHPDLIVAWQSGNNAAVLQRLRELGIPIFLSEPRHLEAIADEIDALGVLAGSRVQAAAFTTSWRARLQSLRERYHSSKPVPLFYEIWNEPLMTINGRHIISDVIALCGGRNIFAEQPALVPRISVEAILAADPQVIIASGMGAEHPEWLDAWRKWPELKAVKENHLYFIPPDLIQRATPRILDGAEQMCGMVEQARGH